MQKLHWDVNSLLPYDVNQGVHDDSLKTGPMVPLVPQQKLDEIKSQLLRRIGSSDYAPGGLFWAKQLTNYLDLKFPLSMEDRKAFVRLFMALAITPQMELPLVSFWIQCVYRLLNRKIWQFDLNELKFNWRPLYQLIRKMFFAPQYERMLISDGNYLSQVVRILPLARRFFPVEETIEDVMREFLPLLTPVSMTDYISGLSLMTAFLPTYGPGVVPIIQNYTDFLFNSWSTIINVYVVDVLYMDFFARLAEHQFGRFFFTEDHIRHIMDIGLRWLEIPIGTGLSKNASGGLILNGKNLLSSGNQRLKSFEEPAGVAMILKRKRDKFKLLAQLMIYTIYPENNGHLSSLPFLHYFFQATESFFHPSNSGRWSSCLAQFLHFLTVALRDRVEKESQFHAHNNLIDTRDEPVYYSKDFFLDPVIVRKLVRMIRRPLFMALFGKDGRTVSNVCSTLHQLAWIDPDAVLPELLEKTYPSLETLTEAHRLHSCLSALGAVAIPMFHRKNFPSGATHFVTLLDMILPALDLNDPMKLSLALGFLNKVFVSIPLVETTYSKDYERQSKPSLDLVDLNVPSRDESSLHMYDQLCSDSTRELEGFVVSFMAKIFSLLRNMPATNEDDPHSGNSVEATLTQLIPFTSELFFMSLSPSLLDIAIDQMQKFLYSSVLRNSLRATALLVASITRANPEKCVNVFLPFLHGKIMHELEHGAGQSPSVTTSNTNAANQSGGDHHTGQSADFTLTWYLHILSHMIALSDAGPTFLKHKTMILDIVDVAWSKCKAFEGFKRTAKVLRAFIGSLCKMYIIDSMNDVIPKDHIKWWGMSIFEQTDRSESSLSELMNIRWHIPSEEEISLSVELLKRYIEPEFVKLEQLANATVDKLNSDEHFLLNNEILKCLTMIQNLCRSVSTLVGDQVNQSENDAVGEADHESISALGSEMDIEDLQPTSGSEFPTKVPIVAGYALKKADDPRMIYIVDLRNRLGDLLHKMLYLFAQSKEDNVESFKSLIKIVRVFLTDRGVEKSQFEANTSHYRIIKDWMRPDRDREGKLYPRLVLLHRVYLQHLTRLRHNSLNIPLKSTLTQAKTVYALIDDLLGLSVCQYSEIRRCAQNVLFTCMRCYPSIKYKLLPKVFERMEDAGKTISELTQKDPQSLEIEKQYNVLKGSLYLVNAKCFMNMCLRNLKHTAAFMVHLSKAQLIDKPSVQALVRAVFLEFYITFSSTSFQAANSVELTKELNVFAQSTGNKFELDKQLQEKCIERYEQKKLLHQDAQRTIMALFQDVKQDHWRFHLIVNNFVELLNRIDLPIQSEVVTFFAQSSVSEILQVRKVALISLNRLLRMIKTRSLQSSKPDMYKFETDNIGFSTTEYLNHLSTDIYKTQEGWSELCLVDSNHEGWWCWPSQIKIRYGGNEDRCKLFTSDPASRDAIHQLEAILKDSSFWCEFFELASLESTPMHSSAVQRLSGNAPDEQFTLNNACFYKNVSQLFGSFIFKKHFLPTLKKWSISTEKSKQRAAAELAGGIIRGSKHWSFDELNEMWHDLIPILKASLLNVKVENVSVWDTFVRYICSKTDPRRRLPFLRMIFDDPDFAFQANSESSFMEATKLHLKKLLLSYFGWRQQSFAVNMISLGVDSIIHPYQYVRETMGTCVWESVQATFNVPSLETMDNSVDSFLLYVKKGKITIPFSLKPSVVERLRKGLEIVRAKRGDNLKSQEDKGTDFGNSLKSVLRWVTESYNRVQPYLIFDVLLDINGEYDFLSDLMSLPSSDDQDLNDTNLAILAETPECPFPLKSKKEMIARLVQIALESSKTNKNAVQDVEVNKRAKLLTLGFVQVFYFRHLFSFAGTDLPKKMLLFASSMLKESSLEVRQMASITLSGLVRCVNDEQIIAQLLNEFKEVAKKPIRRNSGESPQTNLVVSRHGALLGISALVLAFPYDIPVWLPDALVFLSNFATDPSPIQNTIKRTFTEFRHTHQDTWYEDVLCGTNQMEYGSMYDFAPIDSARSNTDGYRKKGVFTPQHLDALEGLLSGSVNYYA